MALAMSSLTLFLLNTFLLLHFPSPAFSHRPLPETHPAMPALGNPHVEEICSHTRDPNFCKSLNNGDISSIKKVDDNSQTVRIYNAVHDIAAIAKEQISKDANCAHVKVELKGALGICQTSYTEAVASLSCTSPTPESMDRGFRSAEESIYRCREAVDKMVELDLQIAYVKAANLLTHHLISYGIVRTSYNLHPSPPLNEHW